MALRWQLLIGITEINSYTLFKYICLGTLPNFLVFNLGPFPRIVLLNKISGVDYFKGFGTVMVEKIIETIPILLLLFWVLFNSPVAEWITSTPIVLITTLMGGLMFILLFFVTSEKERHGKIWQMISLNNVSKLVSLIDEMKHVVLMNRNIKNILKLILFSLLILFNPTITIYLLLISVGIEATISHSVIIHALLLFGNRIPSLGGIGIIQYICILVLSELAVGADVALGFSIVLHLVFKLTAPIIGILYSPNTLKHYQVKTMSDRNG